MKEFSAPQTPYDERWFALVQPACAALARAAALFLCLVSLLLARTPALYAAAWILWTASITVAAASARFEKWPRARAYALRMHGYFACQLLPPALRKTFPRAEVLLASARRHGESVELAALYRLRLAESIDWPAFDAGMHRAAARIRRTRQGLFAVMIGVAVLRGEALVEGLAVMTAQGGVARFSLSAVQDAQVTVRSPAYLRVPDAAAAFGGTVVIHAGSDVEVRVRDSWINARDIVLEHRGILWPIVADGQGARTVHREVRESEVWRIGRRVAGVFIPDGASVDLQTARDSLPVITLEGAPRQILLGDTDRDGGVSIAYEAHDDHGLREIHLVFRSGSHEERRPIAVLDGEHRSDIGASFIRTTDPFFRKTIGPVEIRVEARDDGREGVRWGQSEALVVLPPAIGTAEAERFQSLVGLRHHEVDRLAHRLERTVPKDGNALAEMLVELEDEREEIEATLATSSLGLSVPFFVKAAVQKASFRLNELGETLPKRDLDGARNDLITATENLVLDLDAALRSLAWADAKVVAKRIGQQVQNASDSIHAAAPPSISDDLARLEAGARTLRILGPLGRDLGDLTEGELSRLQPFLTHDPGAAKFLLAALGRRLARPDPSFGSRGGSKGAPSDGRQGMGGEDASGDPSDGNAGNQSSGASKGSAVDEIAGVQKMLHGAGEALAHPSPFGDVAEREEHAKRIQSMAGADELRHGDGEARLRVAATDVRSGRFREARNGLAQVEKQWGQNGGNERKTLQKQLNEEASWLDEKLHENAQILAGEEARLADRTRQLQRSSKDVDVAKALEKGAEAMGRAARAFAQGQAIEGVAAQRDSLAHLGDAREGHRSEDGAKGDDAAHAAVPKTEEARAAAWRKRVVNGLSSRGASRVPEAVQRYEEGLLR